MASASAPDPRSFTDWSQAFDYPIPTTRQLEQRLRADAATSSTKLRDLVGASYRDLLDTANSIVEIHGQSEQVERLLRKVGTRLDVRGIERGGRNIQDWRNARTEANGRQGRLRTAAMLGLLRGAVAYVASVVRAELDQEISLLTAAKVLIIGRLAEKALSDDDITESDEKSRRSVALLGKRLAAERNKLLRILDRQLANIKTEESAASTGALVRHLTAFALATRSTPTQVLHHFQTVRLDAIRKKGSATPTKAALIRKLDLFIQTMRDSRAVFVDLMAASLRSLAGAPLLQDPSVKVLEQLALDINGLWIDQDVRNFTPWTRHDELSKSKAEDLQRSWARHTLTALSDSVTADLHDFDDIQAVVDARKMFLQTWLSNRQYARHLDTKSALDQLRAPFLSRVITLLSKRFSDLDSAVREPLASMLSAPTTLDSPASLWSSTLTSQELDRGAAVFKSNVVSARKGYTPLITDSLNRFDAAADSIAQAQILVKQMRDARWDDDYDDYDSSSETESTTTSGNSAQEVLGKTDPDTIQEALADATTSTYTALDAFVATQVTNSTDVNTAARTLTVSCDAANAPGMVMLRYLNELRARVPQDMIGTFALQSSQLLRLGAADHVAARVAPVLTAALARTYSSSGNHGVDSEAFALSLLWDNGQPALPIQPSPASIRVLRSVVREMEGLGTELWGAKEGVRDLKRKVAALFETEAQKCIDWIEAEEFTAPASTEGTAKQKTTEETTAETTTEKEEEEDGDGTEEEETKTTEEKKDEEAEQDAAMDESPAHEDEIATQKARHAEQKTQRLTQLLFDLLYLQQALASPGASSHPAIVPGNLLSALDFANGQADSDSEEMKRLRKGAQEYWKRTYLLFGLLA